MSEGCDAIGDWVQYKEKQALVQSQLGTIWASGTVRGQQRRDLNNNVNFKTNVKSMAVPLLKLCNCLFYSRLFYGF